MRALGLLLCAIGRHRAAADSVWNEGYGFTKCRRCRTDLVRSLLGGWHVPRKHRVVWRAKPRAAPPPPPAAPRRAPPRLPRDQAAAFSPFDFSGFDQPARRADPGERADPADRQRPPSGLTGDGGGRRS